MKISRLRSAAYFAVATLVGLSAAILAIEMLCRLTGVGQAPKFWPSRLGYQQVGPVFDEVVDQRGAVWFVGGRTSPIRSVVFPKHKGERTFRVFAFGGSAAWGFGYYGGGSFPTLLKRLIEARYPDRDVEVINMAQVGYASPQILLRVEEVLDGYDPDLLVIYAGHNEALELKSIFTTTGQSLDDLEVRWWLRDHSAFYRGLKKLAIERFYRPGRTGLEVVRVHTDNRPLDERETAWVRGQFKGNLDRTADLAASRGVPLFISTVAWNGEYQNEPAGLCPFCGPIEQAAPGSPPDRMAAESAWAIDWAFALVEHGLCDRARPLLSGRDEIEARYMLAKCGLDGPRREQALAVIEQIASGWTFQGNSRESQAGDVLYLDAMAALHKARGGGPWPESLIEDYTRIKESMLPALRDPTGPEPRRLSYMARLMGDQETAVLVEAALLDMPLPTADPATNEIIRGLAGRPGVTVVDVEKVLRDRSLTGVVGYESMLDYCHPNIDGAMAIALEFEREIELSGLLGPQPRSADPSASALPIMLGFWDRGLDETDIRYFTGVGPWPVMLYNPNPPIQWRAELARALAAEGRADPVMDLYAAYADFTDNGYGAEQIPTELIPRIERVSKADPSLHGLKTTTAWLALTVGDVDLALKILDEADPRLDPDAARFRRWIEAAAPAR